MVSTPNFHNDHDYETPTQNHKQIKHTTITTVIAEYQYRYFLRVVLHNVIINIVKQNKQANIGDRITSM